MSSFFVWAARKPVCYYQSGSARDDRANRAGRLLARWLSDWDTLCHSKQKWQEREITYAIAAAAVLTVKHSICPPPPDSPPLTKAPAPLNCTCCIVMKNGWQVWSHARC